MSVLHLDDLRLGAGDALLLVSVQNDFLPGGTLAVPGGDEILAVVDRALDRFASHGLPMFAARCWHAPGESHCEQDTPGAELAPGIPLRAVAIVSQERHADSAFADCDLEARLCAAEVQHLFVGGLPAERALATIADALDRGFCVTLLGDAVRALDARAAARAVDEMRLRGAVCIEAGPHRPSGHAAV